MTRFTAFFLVLAASVSLMVGCDSKKTDSVAGAFIGIAIPETHVTRWIKDGNSLKAEAEKRGYRAEVQLADANQSIQNRQISSYISAGAKLLVVSCISEEIAPVIAEAAQANVAVIAYDRLIQNSDGYDYYITFNNFKVGELMGQSLVAGLELDAATAEAPKTIALFAGSSTDGNAFFFYDGAMSILNPYIEKGVLKVVGPYPRTSDDTENFAKIAVANWQGPTAKTMAVNLLATDAKDAVLDAVLAPNDFISRTIADVLKADAKYKDKLPLMTGQDAEFESVLAVKEGYQYCTVFKNTTKLAEAAIILADQVLKGQTPSIPGAVLATGKLAKMGDTGKKTVKTYLLDPVLITKNNINVPIAAEFYTEAETAELTK